MEINLSNNRYIAYLLSMTCFCVFVYNYKIDYINYNQYPIHSSRISKNPGIVTKVSAKTENQRHGCGVIVFAHIHKCAGGTVKTWFEKHAPVLYMIANQEEQGQGIIQYDPNWKKAIPQVDYFLADVPDKTRWKVLHLHHFFPGLYLSRKYIEKWKRSVENKGCIFYKTTVLRDPLARFISHVNYRNSINKEIPSTMVDNFMEGSRNWLIRFLLFGVCGNKGKDLTCRYQFSGNITSSPNLNERLTTEMKMILNDFDLIGFSDNLEDYFETIRKITGWKDRLNKDIRIHKSKDTFNITRNMLEKFLKLNQKDYMFYNKMKNNIIEYF